MELFLFFSLLLICIFIVFCFLRNWMDIVGHYQFIIMKFFIIVLIFAMGYLFLFYQKALTHFFQKMSENLPSMMVDNLNCPKIDVSVDLFYYLFVLWISISFILLPFPFFIKKKDIVYESGTQILKYFYYIFYNIPLYLLSILLLCCFVAHLLRIAGNVCGVNDYFNDKAYVKDSFVMNLWKIKNLENK